MRSLFSNRLDVISGPFNSLLTAYAVRIWRVPSLAPYHEPNDDSHALTISSVSPMNRQPPLRADTPEGFTMTLYLVFTMGFVLALFLLLAVLGFKRLTDISLVVLFAVPVFAGSAAIGLLWVIHRAYGAAGVVAVYFAVVGLYLGMIAGGTVVSLMTLWKYGLPIMAIAMLAGGAVGLAIGMTLARSGNMEIPRMPR